MVYHFDRQLVCKILIEQYVFHIIISIQPSTDKGLSVGHLLLETEPTSKHCTYSYQFLASGLLEQTEERVANLGSKMVVEITQWLLTNSPHINVCVMWQNQRSNSRFVICSYQRSSKPGILYGNNTTIVIFFLSMTYSAFVMASKCRLHYIHYCKFIVSDPPCSGITYMWFLIKNKVPPVDVSCAVYFIAIFKRLQ